MARTTSLDFNSAHIKQFFEAISKGLSYKRSANYAVIPERNIFYWLRRGKEAETKLLKLQEDGKASKKEIKELSESVHLQFLHHTQKLIANLQKDLLERISKDDPKFIAERRFPNEFGTKARLEIVNETKITVTVIHEMFETINVLIMPELEKEDEEFQGRVRLLMERTKASIQEDDMLIGGSHDIAANDII